MKSSPSTPSQYEGGGTKTVSMFSKLVSQGSSFVMEGVKNLVVKRHVSTTFFFKFRIILKFDILAESPSDKNYRTIDGMSQWR